MLRPDDGTVEIQPSGEYASCCLATASRHIALGRLGCALMARLDSLSARILAHRLFVAIQADFPGYGQPTSP